LALSTVRSIEHLSFCPVAEHVRGYARAINLSLSFDALQFIEHSSRQHCFETIGSESRSATPVDDLLLSLSQRHAFNTGLAIAKEQKSRK
jgi:hypothetical protein